MNRVTRSLILFIVISANSVAARQPEGGKDDQQAALKKEVVSLRQTLDSLRSIQRLSQDYAERSAERLEERIEKRLQELERKIDAIARSTAFIVFNPRTTAFINFASRGDDETVMDAKGQTEISNKQFLRTMELDLRAPVDPYSEAVAIISLEDEAGTGFAIDAEEVYGVIKRLPILEEAPLGLKLKVGKFRAPFGVNNKLHMHDLPWTTRPLAVARYLGTEHGEFFESGFNPVGMDMDFFLPNPIPGSTLEMNLDFLRSGDLGLAGSKSGNQPAYLAHLNFCADWRNEHILIVGGSAYKETGTSSASLYGIDVTYKWAPTRRRESRSFVAGAELLVGNHSFDDENEGRKTTNPVGSFAYIQYQLSYSWYLGARYDWIQEPSNDHLTTKSLSAYASYYTTEFLRFRVGLEHRVSDLLTPNKVNTAVFEVNFVFGSHPIEPYWVSR